MSEIFFDVLLTAAILIAMRGYLEIALGHAKKYRVAIFRKDEDDVDLRQVFEALEQEADALRGFWQSKYKEQEVQSLTFDDAKNAFDTAIHYMKTKGETVTARLAERMETLRHKREVSGLTDENKKLRYLLKWETWGNGLAFPVCAAGIVEVAKIFFGVS